MSVEEWISGIAVEAMTVFTLSALLCSYYEQARRNF